MSEPLFVTNTIDINAPANEVWDALINPEKTKTYMFGCEPVTSWQPGDDLLWKGVFNGQELVAVKGKIVSIQPGKRLEYTTIDPNNPAMPDEPENYLNVIYEVVQEGESTRLTVSQGDFATVAKGAERYQDVYNNGEGWNPILVQIKQLVERK